MLCQQKGVLPGSDFYFFTPSAVARERLFYFTSLGHFFCDLGYRIEREEDYGNYLLLLVKKGRLMISAEGKKSLVKAGDMAFLNCHLPHGYYAAGYTEFLWIHFDGSNAGQFYRDIISNFGGRNVFCPDRVRQMEDKLREIISNCRYEKAITEYDDSLLHNFYNMQVLDDDKVVAPYFGVWWDLDLKPWGFHVKKKLASDGGLGQHFAEQVEDLGEEMDKFKPSVFRLKTEETNAYFKAAQDAFGDILPVKHVGKSLTCWLTQDIVHILGMENMYYVLYDYPDEFMQILSQLADDYLKFFEEWQDSGLLYPTSGYEECNQGSICLNEELPSEGPVKLNQIWLHMDSQETINISQDMFETMIWDSYKKVADRFGLVSFG